MNEWTMAGRPALLIVHMQNSVIKTPSPLEVLGHGKAAHDDGVIDSIARLVAAFRDRHLPVLYSVAYTAPDAKWPAYGGFWQTSRHITVNRMGTWDVEVIEELGSASGEPIFYNWPFSPFEGTGLHEHMQQQEVDTVVLTGVATGMSVGTAAWALAERFYNLVVPSDAVTDANREVHRVILGQVLPAIALITTTEDVIAHL